MAIKGNKCKALWKVKNKGERLLRLCFLLRRIFCLWLGQPRARQNGMCAKIYQHHIALTNSRTDSVGISLCDKSTNGTCFQRREFLPNNNNNNKLTFLSSCESCFTFACWHTGRLKPNNMLAAAKASLIKLFSRPGIGSKQPQQDEVAASTHPFEIQFAFLVCSSLLSPPQIMI